MRSLVIGLALASALGAASASGQTPGSRMAWLNAPKRWSESGAKIEVETEKKTDFWRVTHYGYVTDNGHFYSREVEGDFVATVKVRGEYKSLYDQAGLMARVDEKNWVKTGIEFVNDTENISTVFTRDVSDWSVIPKATRSDAVWLRLVRAGDYVETAYSLDGKTYTVVREGYFPPKRKCRIGVMSAAPEGAGFRAVFEDFTVAARP